MPVFWDMYGQVKTAHYFLQTGFKHLLPNGNGFTDNGHFPLYSLYLAFLFKYFGFKIWVAHLSVLPFITGAFYQLQQLCRRYLNDVQTFWSMTLAVLQSAFIAQSLYFSSEVAFACLSLWMLNSLLNERASHIFMASCLLCLLNLRALPFILLLFVYFSFYKKQKNAWYLSVSILLALIWMLLHYRLSGWFFENSENQGTPHGIGFQGHGKEPLLVFG